MCFTVHILIVDDREEFIDQVKIEINLLAQYFGNSINTRHATNLPDAVQILRDSGIKWDVLITNLALGDPSNKIVRKLGVKLAELAQELGLTTIVVSAAKNDITIRKLYRELKIYDYIFKGITIGAEKTFEERLNSCISDVLSEKLLDRYNQDQSRKQDRQTDVDLQAHVSYVVDWLSRLYNAQDCKRVIAQVGLDDRRIAFQNQSSIATWESIFREARKHAFIDILEEIIDVAGDEFYDNPHLPDIRDTLAKIKEITKGQSLS